MVKCLDTLGSQWRNRGCRSEPIVEVSFRGCNSDAQGLAKHSIVDDTGKTAALIPSKIEFDIGMARYRIPTPLLSRSVVRSRRRI
jgi:hypothetical protein